MHTNLYILLAVFLVQLTGPDGLLAQHTEDDLRGVERKWLDAYENNDRDAMDEIVAEGFIITYASGQQRDKQQTIEALDPERGNNPNSRMYTEDDEVRFFGDDVAVITGTYVYEVTDEDGTARRDSSLYTDTYVYMDERWQVIASHLSKPRPRE